MTIYNNKKAIFVFGSLSLMMKIAFVYFIAGASVANARTTPESFADLADKLLPTVVNISTTQKVEDQAEMQVRPFGRHPGMPQFPEGHPFNDFFEDFFGQEFEQFQMRPMPRQRRLPATSMGSGFILDKDKGIIITNAHVIHNADEIKVTLHDDTVLDAELIGEDSKTDVAVLKVDLSGQNVSETQFGNSDDMRVGDWVIAIGNPFGLGGTVTAGIISARQRDINSGPYDDYLQTDASINRGNSGGPMFNMDGEVIGINTAIFSPTGGSVGIGFAIPSVLAEPVISQLNKFGRTRRGWLGVKIQDVDEDIAASLGLAKPAGALVAEVTPTGPAEKAGVKPGDVILTFDGKPVREMRELPRIVAETDIDKDVDVIVWRDGERVTLNANTGELEKAEDEGLLAAHEGENIFDPTNEDAPVGTEFKSLGMNLAVLTPALRNEFALSEKTQGLVILSADPNGPAAAQGLGEGDVIVSVNQKKATLDIMMDEIESVRDSGRNAVLLMLNRRGTMQFVAVKLADIN